jgi:DMSO/TMAO reductase YedYZ molybdopterin-dependent catalytic subunit
MTVPPALPALARRDILRAALAVPLAAAVGACAAETASRQPAVLTAADLELAPGTAYPLVALPGKSPMGQIYDRPPNYETPAGRLIGQRNYPYTDNDYYYVRYREADVPKISRRDYTLTLGGDAATRELTLSFDDLADRADTTIGTVGSCTGEGVGMHRPIIAAMPWMKGDVSCAEWTGVRVADLLREAGITPAAQNVSFQGGRVITLTKPEYWRSYPAADLLGTDAILAVRMNGEDLNFWNGFPVRLVVPGCFSPSWVKQVVRMEARTTPHPLEWSGRKITLNKLKLMSLISTPTDGTPIPRGATVELTGVAYDDGTGISAVETSLDDGATWQPADLEDPVSRHAWRVFRARATFPTAGQQRVLSRSIGTNGDVQDLDPSPDAQKNAGRKETASRLFAAVYEVVA